jgi:hypothetical protein
VENVSASDGVPSDHCDDGLGDPADQDLKVEDVEATDTLLSDLVVTDVAIGTSDLLVTTGTEGVGPLPCQDDGAD